MANEVGYLKIDIENLKIDKYALPRHGLFAGTNDNTNTEKVLYESVGDGLRLYEYDLKSGQDKLIVAYPKNIFDRYCASWFEYAYPSGFYGNCGRDRGLRAQWEDTGISYFDFITGKKVVLTTNCSGHPHLCLCISSKSLYTAIQSLEKIPR